MKTKLTTATLIGLLACCSGRAQTPATGDTPVGENPATIATAPAAAETAEPVTGEPADVTGTTDAQPAAVEPISTTESDGAALAAAEPAAADTAAAEPAATEPAATEPAAADADTNTPAAATADQATTEPADTTTAAPSDTDQATAEPAAAAPADETATNSEASAVIPLIQFQDVSLTTAIENLARQAGLNYILDPKVTFGQPDEKGQIRPQPNINLRWENLTANQALMALLSTYNLQLVEDPRTKVSRITVKDPTAPDPLITKVIQLKYAGPSNVLNSIQSTFADPKRSKVIPDVRTSQLVVVATEKEHMAVEELLAELDKPTRQVLIEAKIYETTVNPTSIKGIDWSGTLSAQRITMGNNSLPGTDPVPPQTIIDANGNPVQVPGTPGTIGGILNDPKLLMSTAGKFFQPSTAFLNADGLDVALSFLNKSDDTKVISEPRVVTLDNMQATINVGLMFPIVNVQAATVQTAGGSSISYSNLTVNLDVTPRITANDFIEMHVAQSVLRLGPTFKSKVADQENEVDSFFTRRMETGVLIPSANTLVMGGLISDEQGMQNTKVPILGDIPILGYAFRKDAKRRNKSNLIIFLTPTIVQDNDFQPTETTFLKSTGKEEVEEGWSFWDSGKPAFDWSKPKTEPEPTYK